MSKLLYTEIYSCDTFSQLTLHKGKYNKKINIYNQENINPGLLQLLA